MSKPTAAVYCGQVLPPQTQMTSWVPGYWQQRASPQSSQGQLVQPRPTVNRSQLPRTHTSSRAQTLLQSPQLMGSQSMNCWLTQESPLGSQLSKLLGQSQRHRPLAQRSPLVGPPMQGLAQAPQWLSLLFRSTHWPKHSASPGRHWQDPSMQYCRSPQRLPQVPQFRGSRARSRQVWLPPQGLSPNRQPQLPLLHTPKSGSQALPQAPQFAGSLERSTQLPPQVTWPAGHWQTPALHEAPWGQALPQEPQFAGSLVRSAQLLPQSSCPAGHWHTPETQVAP